MNREDIKIIEESEEDLFEFAEYDEKAGEITGSSDYSYWKSTFKVFLNNKVNIFFLTIFI